MASSSPSPARSTLGRWLLAGLGLAALLAVALSLGSGGLPAVAVTPDENEGDWVPVKFGDFEILFREEGELRPAKVTTLTFLRIGKLSYLIPEGTYVKKGEKVVALETRDLEDELQRMSEDLSNAEKALAQQTQSRDLEFKRLEQDLETERERVNVALLREQELLAKPLPVDREEAENALSSAKARLANANADYEALQPLAEKGFASGQDIRSRELAVKKAEVELQRAEMKYKQTIGGALPEERAAAKLARESAELALKLKVQDEIDKKDDLNAKVATAERQLRLLEKRYANKKEDVARSVVLAPHDGLVIHRVIGYRSTKKVQIGDLVGPYASPVELPNLERMKVRTQAPESFIRLLKARKVASADPGTAADPHAERKVLEPGSPARVIVKTMPGRVYTGEVTWIDGWARDRNSKLSEADIRAQGLSGVRIFDVEVELHESDLQRLREGFRATVEFPVETRSGVHSIPMNAVDTRSGAPRVRVQSGSSYEWRTVELGEQSNDRVIVLSGLKEGEQVFTPKPPPKPAEPSKQAGMDDEPVRDIRASRPSPGEAESNGGGSGTPGGTGGAGKSRPGGGPPGAGGDGAPKRRRGGGPPSGGGGL